MEEKKIIISTSILSSNFTKINEALSLIDSAGADWIHLDVMDGLFVPEISFGQKMIKDIKPLTNLPLDVHLMVENSDLAVQSFIDIGVSIITVHYESTKYLHKVISQIKSSNVKAGVSIIPSTSVELLKPILDTIDLVLVMSVNPGYGGQSFITSSLDKIKELSVLRKKMGLNFKIAVDGGINDKNINSILSYGADIIIVGSAFFAAADSSAIIRRLRGYEI